MAAPTITIASTSATKISDETGKNQSVVAFTSNQNIIDFIAKTNGTSYETGVTVGRSDGLRPGTLVPGALIPKGYTLTSGIEQEFEVDDTELTGGDGVYRVNVYGKNTSSEWSAYG